LYVRVLGQGVQQTLRVAMHQANDGYADGRFGLSLYAAKAHTTTWQTPSAPAAMLHNQSTSTLLAVAGNGFQALHQSNACDAAISGQFCGWLGEGERRAIRVVDG